MPRKAKEVETGRNYGGESAEGRLARQRRVFMDAGLELIGTIGYRAMTVRLLCKQAGLIDRYFYKNFTDTEDLLEAIYKESLDQIETEVLKAVNAVAATAPPEQLVTEGLEAFFRAFENSRVARVCWLEVLGVSPRIDRLYTQRIEHFGQLLLVIARGMMPKMQLSAAEAHYIGIALIGAISQSATQWLLSGYHAERSTLVSANSKVLRGTINAIREG